MPDPKTTPEQLPETDMGLESIKKDVAQLKKDSEALQAKQADFEKNKNTLTKEDVDRLKKEIADEILRIENKKKELLELIKQTKWELVALQGSVETNTEKAELEELEKEINAIQLSQADIEQKWWFRKQRDAVTSKEEWKTNTLPNIARVAVGVGAVALARKWIKRIFGIGKNKQKEWWEASGKEKKTSFWKKALLWGGWIVGWLMIWKNRDKITDRISWLFGPKDPDRAIDKDYSDLTNVDQMDKDFEKSPRMVDYNVFGEKVNEFYTNIYGWGAMDGPDLLWEKAGEKQLEKNTWTIPFILDEMYTNVDGILSERALFSEQNISKEWQITKYFMDKCPKFIWSILSPFVWTFAWLTKDMFNFDSNGRMELNQKGMDALEKNKWEETETIFRNVYRKFIKVRVFLEDKEDQLRYIYTKKKLVSLWEIKSWMSEDDIDEYVDEKVHDDDFQEKNIDDLIKADFYDKKIISEMNKPGAFETLKDNNILDWKLGDDIQKEVETIDKRKKWIIWDTFEDILNGSEDINGASTKEDLWDICIDMKEEIQSDFLKESFITRKLGIFGNLFNLEWVAKEQLLEMFGYQALTQSYIEQITNFEKKLSWNITKQDILDFKSTVDQFFMFEKEIMTGVGMMVDVKEENGSIIVRMQTVSGLVMNRYMNLWAWWKIATITAVAIWLWTKRWRKWVWKLTKIAGGIVLYPIAKLTGKSVDAMWRVLRRWFGKTLIWKLCNRYRFTGDKWPEELKDALRNREISLDQATKIAKKRATYRIRKDRKNVNNRIPHATTDETITRRMLLKAIVDPSGVVFKWPRELELIGKYFDETPWNTFFLSSQEVTKKWAFRLLQSYDQKIISLNKLWKTSKIDFMQKCLTRSWFYDFENIKKLIGAIDTLDIDTLTPGEMSRLVKKLGKNIKNLTDTQAICDFVKEAKNAKLLTKLTTEQKAILKFLDDDIADIVADIEKNVKNMPWYKAWWALDIHYKNILAKTQDFKYKIKGMSVDEILAFKKLRTLWLKTFHVAELFELKKIAAVAKELKGLEDGTRDLSKVVSQLKASKKSGAEISESLIKTLEDIHVKNAMKSADEVVEIVKSIFKILSKIT